MSEYSTQKPSLIKMLEEFIEYLKDEDTFITGCNPLMELEAYSDPIGQEGGFVVRALTGHRSCKVDVWTYNRKHDKREEWSE